MNLSTSNDQWLTFIATQIANNKVLQATLSSLTSPPSAWLCSLESWSILSVSGEDALSFLQGQISCDMQEVANIGPRLACCVNLQGRIISNFIISLQPILKGNEAIGLTNFYLLCRTSNVSALKTTLTKYAIFSKVTIEQDTEHCLFVKTKHNYTTSQTHTHTNNPSNNTATDPSIHSIEINASKINFLVIPKQSAIDIWEDLVNEYKPYTESWFEYCLIQEGLTFLTQDLSEKFTPQEVNFDLVNGISFSKGCYTGQEVVARLHYRGKTKRHALIAEIQNASKELKHLVKELEATSLTLNDFQIQEE